jgi:hypothetical protein
MQSQAALRQAGPDAPPRIVGWLVDLVELSDGSLAQTIQIDDPQTADAIAAGQLRFSSPELRPRVQLDGSDHVGPLIAHIALTQRPLCAGQTPLVRIPPSHDSYSLFPQGASVMSNANQLLEHAIAAQQSPPNESQGDSQPGDKSSPAQTAPPREQPETDQASARSRSRQTSGADANAAGTLTSSAPDLPHDVFARRSRLAERIRLSRVLPKGLRDRFAERVETVQLSSDADPTPVIPVAEAVEMIEAALPEHVQLAPEQLATPAHPHGESFFTGGSRDLSDEDAKRIAAEQLAASGFGPPA